MFTKLYNKWEYDAQLVITNNSWNNPTFHNT